MSAAELRALAERLCAVEPHDYEDRVTLEAAAEIIDLLAWAEEKRVEVEFGGRFWWVKVAGDDGFLSSGPTYIGTLRRAREASKS